MRTDLLWDRQWTIEGDWYAPINHLSKYKSVVDVEFFDQTSSAGDWSGFFIQRFGDTNYVITFSQENRYPKFGFMLYTGDVIMTFKGDIDNTIIESINRSILEMT